VTRSAAACLPVASVMSCGHTTLSALTIIIIIIIITIIVIIIVTTMMLIIIIITMEINRRSS